MRSAERMSSAIGRSKRRVTSHATNTNMAVSDIPMPLNFHKDILSCRRSMRCRSELSSWELARASGVLLFALRVSVSCTICELCER